MKKIILLILFFFDFQITNVVFAQLSDSSREELTRTAMLILSPQYNYQYSIESDYVKQKIKERTGSFFMTPKPADTLEIKKQLKNDTSDARLCFNLFFLYKSLNKSATAKFYFHKSLYLYNQKLQYNPVDTVAASQLALLYSADSDYEAAIKVYKILAQASTDKEVPYMMLSMLYIGYPDSMAYYINKYNQENKDDYKKILIYTMLRSLQFIANYDEKDSSTYSAKKYQELWDWTKIDSIYEKHKSEVEYQLMYNAVRTYMILMQCSILGDGLFAKYTKELSELEKYYLDFIKKKKYKNKLVPYLSLSAMYTVQKKYDQAIAVHQMAYEFIKKYNVTDSKKTEEIISSYLGLFEVSKKYKEGVLFAKALVDSNAYNISYRKAYIYFLYQSSGYSKEIENQVSKIAFYNPDDIYPQLMDTYEALKKQDYDSMYVFLKQAYAKNSSERQIYAFMAVIYIMKGKTIEAERELDQIENLMPMTADKLRAFIK